MPDDTDADYAPPKINLNLDELRASYRIACRKPHLLELWAFDNIPGLLDELERLYREQKSKSQPKTKRRGVGHDPTYG